MPKETHLREGDSGIPVNLENQSAIISVSGASS